MFSWPLNGKTYLIRGRQYWRYDEAAARPDPGYPRDLSLWEGAPPAPDDVTVSNTGGRARAMGGQGSWGGGACIARAGGRSGAERGVWRVGRRGPAPQTSPPSPQVTPTSSRASTTGASPRAASKPSQTPPNPWVPSSWTAPPPVCALRSSDPPEQPLNPETVTVSARSVRLQGGLRCSSCLFCPCWWGVWPPPEGACGCLEGTGSPTGPPRVVAVGSLSQAQDSARMQLGMPVELSPGGWKHRAGPGTERPCVQPTGPSSPAPGHDPAGLSFSRNTWPFPELRRLNSCSPGPASHQQLSQVLGSLQDSPTPPAEPALQPLL